MFSITKKHQGGLVAVREPYPADSEGERDPPRRGPWAAEAAQALREGVRQGWQEHEGGGQQGQAAPGACFGVVLSFRSWSVW